MLSRYAIMLAVSISCSIEAAPASKPVFIYGSLEDRPTRDRDAEGGNPFATALVHLLACNSTSFTDFKTDLSARTRLNSQGTQQPEVVGGDHLSTWTFLPKPIKQKWVALVVVFSEYGRSDVGPSLPGAKHDMSRVANALSGAGFTVTSLADPNEITLAQALTSFGVRSATADVAVIYTTGHGVEMNGVPRVLLPYERTDGSKWVTVPELAVAARAKRANLIFYAACRTKRQ